MPQGSYRWSKLRVDGLGKGCKEEVKCGVGEVVWGGFRVSDARVLSEDCDGTRVDLGICHNNAGGGVGEMRGQG